MNYIVEFKGEFNVDPEVYAVLVLNGEEVIESKIILTEEDFDDLSVLRLKLRLHFNMFFGVSVI